MTKRKRSDKSTASGASLGGRNETASVPAGKAPDEIVGKLNPTRPDIPGPLEVGESRRSIQALIRGAEGKLPTAIARRFVDAELLPQSAALALYAMLSLAPLLLILVWPTSTMLPDAQEALMEQIAMLIGSDAEQVARNAFASVDWMLPVIANLATWLIYVVVFALMYHYLPDRSVSWKHAVGVGSALFVLGRTAIGWYLDRAEPESAYGYMGALILALLWIYYSALVVFLGALITAVVDERRKARKAERNSATNTRATRTSRRCALAAPSALSDVALRRCFASWIGQDNAGRGNEYDFKRHDAAIVQLHLGAQCISAGFWARGR